MLLIKSKAFSFFLCMIVILPFSCSSSCTFTITNNCPNTIWPGTLAGSGTPQLSTTGFRLEPEQSVRLGSISGWSGRIWAITGCTFNEFGVGKCQTGDCGGKLECIGNGATPPASLFEITLGKGNDKDFYDISLVDGYNLPLLATPHPSFGACNATGCISDVNMGCPKELQVVGEGRKGEGGVIACKSACEAFGLDHYCCSGEFGNPTTCKPSYYSTIFKRACPTAYSYAYDDGTSTFTCKAYDYTIVFCPNLNGMKKPVSNLTPPTTQEPSMSTPPVMPTTLTPPAIQQPFTSPPATQQLTLTHPPATPQPSTLTPPTTQQPSTLMPPPAIQQPSTLTPPPATPQPSTLTPPLATQQPSTMTPPPTTQVPSTSTPSTVREPTIEGTSALASYSTKLLPLQLWIILLVINIITFTY